MIFFRWNAAVGCISTETRSNGKFSNMFRPSHRSQFLRSFLFLNKTKSQKKKNDCTNIYKWTNTVDLYIFYFVFIFFNCKFVWSDLTIEIGLRDVSFCIYNFRATFYLLVGYKRIMSKDFFLLFSSHLFFCTYLYYRWIFSSVFCK